MTNEFPILNPHAEIIFNQGRLKENLNLQVMIIKNESLSELCKMQISNYLRENQFFIEKLINDLMKDLENE